MEIWFQLFGRFQPAAEVRFLTYTLHNINLGVVCYICDNTFAKFFFWVGQLTKTKI